MPAPKRRLPTPPYNPGVRDLVEGKRAWDARANPPDQRKGFRGWNERGYLPHRDSPGLTQFITYHLAGAFPTELLGEWTALLKIEHERERRKELEGYLDKGRGECWLRRPEFARICEDGFRHFDRERYELKAWCLMPNHVHVLVLVTTVPMAEFVKSWKGYTAYRCNDLLPAERGLSCLQQPRKDEPIKNTGKSLRRLGPAADKHVSAPANSFWAEDYWDTYMRDSEQERRTIHYIERNPVKAGLVALAADWPWSSARFRDQYGVLRVPPLLRAKK
jgi:putative transposase